MLALALGDNERGRICSTRVTANEVSIQGQEPHFPSSIRKMYLSKENFIKEEKQQCVSFVSQVQRGN
jgi:hypothetical protein